MLTTLPNGRVANLERPQPKYARQGDLPTASDLIGAIRAAYENRDASHLPELHDSIAATISDPSEWFSDEHFDSANENGSDALDVLLFAVFWAGYSQAQHSRDITQGTE